MHSTGAVIPSSYLVLGRGSASKRASPKTKIVDGKIVRQGASTVEQIASKREAAAKAAISRLAAAASGPKIKVAAAASPKPPKSTASVTVLSRKEGVSLVEKQLYAFFWLGLDRSAQQLEIENTLYADLLPMNDLFSVGHALNQIFWQPFFNHCKEPCENIYNIFTNEYLPMMKQTLSAPPVLRRSGSPRRRGSKRTTTRKRSKAATA
jgi:hypothetical protein